MEVDKRIAEAEQSAYECEIKRLRDELESMRNRVRSSLSNGDSVIEMRPSLSVQTPSMPNLRDRTVAKVVVVPNNMNWKVPNIKPQQRLSWLDRIVQVVAPYPKPPQAQKSPTSIEHV